MSLSRVSSIAVLTIVISVAVVVQTWPVSLTGLTKSQRFTIEELRDKVEDELPHSYMKEDLYLLRWLSAKNFDVNQAAKLLRENLKWRRENRIDRIMQEDWQQMDADFPYTLNNFDKQGRPILYFSYGDWDIRKLAISGMLPKLGRYFSKMFEDADMKVRAMRAQGSNITQFNMIMNMDGYNLAQHACLPCLPFYTTLSTTLEARYPGTAERVVFVNAPTVFEVVLSLIRGVLSSQARETMKIYGTDRKLWESKLLEFIDRSQFPGDL